MIDIEILKLVGCEWFKDGRHRIYFNDIDKLAGLVITRYNTGNISSAYFNGERISNTRAGKICTDSFSKLWYDVKRESFFSKNVHSDVESAAIKTLEELCNGRAFILDDLVDL